MSFNLAVKVLCGKNIDMIQSCYIKIQNASTFFTDKMVMWFWITVKTIRSDSCRQLLDLTDICKQ